MGGGDVHVVPGASLGLKIKCDYECYDASLQTVQAMVSLTAAPSSEDADKRAPVDISIALDVSGSMAGSKITMCKRTASYLITQMGPQDHLGLVVYDTTVREVMPRTSMANSSDREAFEKAIGTLRAGTATNLSGGLLAAIDQQVVAANNDKGSADAMEVDSNKKAVVRSVLLFTDGLANQGIKDADALATAVSKTVNGEGGGQSVCSVFTFGFGADHDESMLQTIADAGGGMYYFIDSEDGIPEAFADALGGLQSVSAQNIKVSMSMDGARLVEVLGKHSAEINENGAKCEITLKDMYAEETRDLLLQVELPKLESVQDGAQATLSAEVSYFDVGLLEQGRAMASADFPRVQTLPEGGKSLVRDFEVDRQRNRIVAAKAMESALVEAGIKKISGLAAAAPFAMANAIPLVQQQLPGGSISGSFKNLLGLRKTKKKRAPIQGEEERSASPKLARTESSDTPTDPFALARKGIKDAKEEIEASVSAQDPMVKGLIADLSACLVAIADKANFESWGRKAFISGAKSHYDQRCSGYTPAMAANIRSAQAKTVAPEELEMQQEALTSVYRTSKKAFAAKSARKAVIGIGRK